MTTNTVLYFAYGSNMLESQINERCPSHQRLGVGYVDGWKFQYDGWADNAVGNMVESPPDKVWGVLYRISEYDIEALDGYEHVPVDYERQIFKISQSDGSAVDAYLYVRGNRAVASPSKAYRQIVIDGAEENRLPSDYIAGL